MGVLRIGSLKILFRGIRATVVHMTESLQGEEIETETRATEQKEEPCDRGRDTGQEVIAAGQHQDAADSRESMARGDLAAGLQNREMINSCH